MFIFQSHGHPNDTLSPWYSHTDGYTSTDLSRLPRISALKVHVKALWPPAMLHAAGSDSARAATIVPLSRHTRARSSFPIAHTSAGHQRARADVQKPYRQPSVWIPPAAQHHSIAYSHAHTLTRRYPNLVALTLRECSLADFRSTTLLRTSTTMLGLPTKTYSPKHGKRSYQKHIKPSYAMPVRTHDSRTHDSHTHGSRSGGRSFSAWQPVLKGWI